MNSKKVMDLLGSKMRVVRRIHNGFKEFERAKKDGIAIPCYFGKYQYIYTSQKGEISLVKINNDPGLLKIKISRKLYWEIYCLKGNLFDYVEVFNTKKEAEKVIKRYLENE